MATVTLTVGTGTQQWTPAGDQVGATITKIELWGPGGSGAKRAGRATGGGGGAYNPITVSVTVASLLVGGTVPYETGRGGALVSSVATAGNPGTAKTWFSAVGTYAADFGKGGSHGTSGTVAGGIGGLVANCVPTTNALVGGAGGTDSNASGASGGGSSASSAGAAVAGAAVTTAIGGAGGTAPAGGGNGGAGEVATVDAIDGSSPGGGGGGHGSQNTGNSGAGGDGQIILTYTPGGGGATAPFPPWPPPTILQLGA